MKKLIISLVLFSAAIFFQFCTKTESATILNKTTADVITTPVTSTELLPTLPTTLFDYLDKYPTHVQTALIASDNTPTTNPITNAGATLGRVLFYDKQLSRNSTTSCGSCHKQQFSFDDTTALSKGLDGSLTSRNSMAILNIRFYKSGKMFWDERAATLEKQALMPIQNHVEMDMTLSALEAKVKSLSYYPALFKNAFGTTTIDSIAIAKALSQFERSIVTYQSKYDRVKQGLETFTPDEAAGEQLFLTVAAPKTCASCHTPPMFITSSPGSGFGLNDPNDNGINNNGNFKSGSLRNIVIRSNLFHNGSVKSVQSMMEQGNPGFGNQAIPLHFLKTAQIPSMMAFLNTLTDNTILTAEKFSNPFK